MPRGVGAAPDSWATSWGVLVMRFSLRWWCGCGPTTGSGDGGAPGPPVVALPVQLEVEERLGAADAGHVAQRTSRSSTWSSSSHTTSGSASVAASGALGSLSTRTPNMAISTSARETSSSAGVRGGR